MSKAVTGLALLGAAGISAIALNDAATFALTGQYSRASDEFGVNPMFVLAGVVHALAYLAFTAVLHQRRGQVDGGSRFRRAVRAILMLALVSLAVGMLAGTAVSVVRDEVLGDGIWGWVAGIGFLLMFLCSVLLGFALLRRRDLRLAAWTLVATLPAIGLAILLDALGSPWAHPAYAEVCVSFGLAFIGLAPRREPVNYTAPTPALSPGTSLARTNTGEPSSTEPIGRF